MEEGWPGGCSAGSQAPVVDRPVAIVRRTLWLAVDLFFRSLVMPLVSTAAHGFVLNALETLDGDWPIGDPDKEQELLKGTSKNQQNIRLRHSLDYDLVAQFSR